jgi:hypothetical protein
MTRPPDVAILTGDLIGSTKVDAEVVDRTLALLEKASHEAGSWRDLNPRFTRFRGDGWQIMFSEPQLALRAAVYLLARLRATKNPLTTRIALGFGSIDSARSRDLSDASGEAFINSGRALDAMMKSNVLAVAGSEITPLHSGFVSLLAATIRRWTPEQAGAISIYLHPENPTLETIASQLKISFQAASYRVRGGNGHDLRSALKSWELGAHRTKPKVAPDV